MSPLKIFLASFLVNNIVLMRYIGLCPFFGVSTRFSTSFGMGMAVIFVMTLATLVTYLLYHLFLLPLNLLFLRTAVFILVIASLVQLIEMFMKKSFRALYSAMGIYLPLITTNCAILACTFLVIDYKYSLLNALIFALGTSLGFTFVILLFSAIRERLEYAEISPAFKGYTIAFISAALVSLGFLGFAGLFGISL
uniref:Ion-translocating oxidoreductase complex subunit A n=1 Tax=candidate division WOR-3 bacterium TaxID=2052148 RepID=A0A7C3Z083_UNCW3